MRDNNKLKRTDVFSSFLLHWNFIVIGVSTTKILSSLESFEIIWSNWFETSTNLEDNLVKPSSLPHPIKFIDTLERIRPHLETFDSLFGYMKNRILYFQPLDGNESSLESCREDTFPLFRQLWVSQNIRCLISTWRLSTVSSTQVLSESCKLSTTNVKRIYHAKMNYLQGNYSTFGKIEPNTELAVH
jgi:hypothetical protein